MQSVSIKGGAAWHIRPGLVLQFNGFNGALIDTDAAVGAERRINNGLIVALDSLGWTSINAGLAGCASFGVNFCCHLSTFLLLTKRQKNRTSSRR